MSPLPLSLSLLIFVVVAVSLSSPVSAEGMVDCSGFLKPSVELKSLLPEGMKLDYPTQATLLLKSPQGAVKFTTEPAPNGYYIIPVYESGSYQIVATSSSLWSFSPASASVTVNVDGSGVECIADFVLTGFAVTGKIVGDSSCSNSNLSLSGVALEAVSADGSVGTKVFANSDGTYTVPNLLPGEYVIRASHSSLQFGQSEMNVVITDRGVIMKQNFVVSGFSLGGSVVKGDSNSPFAKVQVNLSSNNVKSVACGAGSTAGIDGNLCTAITNAQGKYLFSNLPCGDYTVTPSFSSGGVEYDVVPAFSETALDAGDPVVLAPFRVKGFSVQGRVVSASGDGIENVAIRSPQLKKETLTDAEGYYKLPEVNEGTYTISATKSHYAFTAITDFVIDETVVEFPDIVATRFEVCGSVEILDAPAGFTSDGRRVTLQNEHTLLTAVTDTEGKYCVEAPAGSYTITAEVTEKERSEGILLKDFRRHLELTNAPLLDISFRQTHLSVGGVIECIDSCTGIELSLSSAGHVTHTVRLDSTGVFRFANVMPGAHTISLGRNSLCFESDTIECNLELEDINDLSLKQTGYAIAISSTHSATLSFTTSLNTEGSSPVVVELIEGDNRICVPKKTSYNLHLRNDCVKFGVADDSVKIDPANQVIVYTPARPHPISLIGERFRLLGSVVVKDQVRGIEDDMAIVVTSNVQADSLLPLTITSSSTSSEGTVFTFSYFAVLEEDVIFTPSSPSLLFYPLSQSVTLSKSSCPPPLPSFDGRPPLFKSGQVLPPATAGVRVSVSYDPENTNTECNSSTRPLPAPTVTDGNGQYRVGPLYDDCTYLVHTELEGFTFSPSSSNPNNFSSSKLGKVVVVVKTKGSSEPLEGVLVALSSSTGFRKNAITTQEGSYTFYDLLPADFYIKPLLKEYTFTFPSPSSPSVTIGSGEDVVVEIVAERVAFSVFGAVTSLNGSPESALVAAYDLTNGGNLFEDTRTQPDGSYRLRGLLPSHTYKIAVNVSGGGGLSRVVPAAVEIAVPAGGADTLDTNFVAFRDSPYTIEGDLDIDPAFLKTVTLTLKKSGSDEVVASLKPFPLKFFSFVNVDRNAEYVISVTTDTNPISTHSITCDPITVAPSTQAGNSNLSCTVTARNDTEEFEERSLLWFWVVIAAAAGYYYRVEVTALYNSYTQPSKQQTADEWTSEWTKKKNRPNTYKGNNSKRK